MKPTSFVQFNLFVFIVVVKTYKGSLFHFSGFAFWYFVTGKIRCKYFLFEWLGDQGTTDTYRRRGF